MLHEQSPSSIGNGNIQGNNAQQHIYHKNTDLAASKKNSYSEHTRIIMLRNYPSKWNGLMTMNNLFANDFILRDPVFAWYIEIWRQKDPKFQKDSRWDEIEQNDTRVDRKNK